MANRGQYNNTKGRGGGARNNNSKSRAQGNQRHNRQEVPIKERLGKIPVYNSKYKSTYNRNVNQISVATLPVEGKVKSLSKEFIKSYYEIFDQPGRPNLHTKYNQDALFTFSTTHYMPPPTEWGRNLLQIAREMRDKILIRNKTDTSLTQIAELFAHFPHTKHMIQNFTYDIPFYLSNPMYVTSLHIVVTGCYEDLSQIVDPLRAFTRVFIVKQVGVKEDGEPIYEIFNDLFMLQTPSPEQIKKYHADQQLARKVAATNTPKQEEMIGRIMARTNMNRKGASQLLVETKWDENTSMQMYESLNQTGKIPPDFFQK